MIYFNYVLCVFPLKKYYCTLNKKYALWKKSQSTLGVSQNYEKIQIHFMNEIFLLRILRFSFWSISYRNFLLICIRLLTVTSFIVIKIYNVFILYYNILFFYIHNISSYNNANFEIIIRYMRSLFVSFKSYMKSRFLVVCCYFISGGGRWRTMKSFCSFFIHSIFFLWQHLSIFPFG